MADEILKSDVPLCNAFLFDFCYRTGIVAFGGGFTAVIYFAYKLHKGGYRPVSKNENNISSNSSFQLLDITTMEENQIRQGAFCESRF